MKRYKSIVLITALILSIAAVFCWQSAKKSRYDTVQETGENAGRTGETGTGTASASAIAETTGTGTGSPSEIAETTGTGTGSPSEIAETIGAGTGSPSEIAETIGTGTGSPSGIIEETETDTEFPAGNPEEVAAVILHTNDVHVGLEENIGYDGLALYKKEIEALYDNVLLIDAGDAIQGAAIGAISKGNEIIKIMNRLGYNLAIPGNHEFDFGFDVLDDCSEQLDCGYTCANFCTIDGETVFEPWRILEAGNLKIGFVGAVTPDTFTKSAIKDVVNEVGEPMYDFLADETGESVTRRGVDRYVDPDMKAFIDEIIESYDGLMSRKIGELSVDLIKRDENGIDISRTQENGLCELAADAFRAVGGTQTALIGAGSVRANLEAGEVTYQDVVDILPYCNDVIITEVSGRMLLDALEFGVSFLPKQAAAFPQVSGITYRINKEMESSVRINEKKQFVSVDGEYRVSDVKVEGKDLDPEAIYTLAIPQYFFTGGDGYTMFEDAEIISTTMLTDNEVVMKYIEEDLNGVIPEKYAEPQGRISY